MVSALGGVSLVVPSVVSGVANCYCFENCAEINDAAAATQYIPTHFRIEPNNCAILPGVEMSLSTLPEPTISDVYNARRAIDAHVHRTPLRRVPGLCESLDADVWVKHENLQILGAFKVRGGVNLVSRTSQEERRRGFVTASTGNHGQSIAFAAQQFGAKCTIVVPKGANPVKIASMRSLGAIVVEHGPTFDQARTYSENLAREEGMRFVHPANEPMLVAGVGTYTLEIYEDLSDIDYIIVPVGAGSGACGASVVTNYLSPSTKIVGVQAEAAPSVYLSWKKMGGPTVDAKMETLAEGLATGSSYDYPVGILRKYLHDFVLVTEEAIQRAIVTIIATTRTLVEHAGATSLAGAEAIRDQIRGKRVVLIASGANITVEQLKTVIGD